MNKRYRHGCCIKCGVFREALHRDHIIPKWNGGLDEETNVQYLCANCHEDKTILESRTQGYREFRRGQTLGRVEGPEMRAKMVILAKETHRLRREREALLSPEARMQLAAERSELRVLDHQRRRERGERKFTPLSDEHRASIVEGKRKRREFLASLTPKERIEFKLQEIKSKLEKLQFQVKRQERSAS